MTCVVNFVFALSKLQGVDLSGYGLVGGNPMMNTPRLRRVGGIAFSSFVFYLYYWYSYIIGYFVCDSASEFAAVGSTSFLGFSYPNLLLVFLNLLFFRNLYHILSQVLGLSLHGSLFIYLFSLFFCTLFWVSL